jgi:hypothetical protein
VKLLLLLLLALPAFAGVGNLPQQHGTQDICTAKVYNPMQIDSCRFIYSIINPGTPYVYHWSLFSAMDNYSDVGENVGIYSQVSQHGKGATWAGVLQATCLNPDGANCYGLELDIAPPVSAAPNGIGVGMVVSRAREMNVPDPSDARTASARFGFLIGENWYDRGKVSVGVAFDADIHCDIACVRVRDGEAIAFSSNALIVQKFDPQTGYAGWWRADLGLCVWCVNMSNGDVRRMWRP